MSSCDHSSSYGISSYPICSSNGICVRDECECFAGWTGYTDLQLEHGYDCDISLLAVKIWSTFNFCLGCISLSVIIYCILRDQIYNHAKIKKVKSVCIMIFFVLVVCTIMFSLEKIMDPESSIIGRSARLELWGLGITSMTCYGVSAYFIIMIKFLRNYSRLLDPKTRALVNDNVDHLIMFAPWFATGFMISYAALLIALHFLPRSYSDSFSIAECLLYTLAYIYYGLTVLYTLHLFLKEMGKVVNNPNAIAERVSKIQNNESLKTSSGAMAGYSSVDDIKSVYSKIRLANSFIIPFYINGVPLNILFASWYFLRRKVVFFYLLQITLVIMMSAFLVWSLTSVKQNGLIERIGSQIRSSLNARVSGFSNNRKSSRSSAASRPSVIKVAPNIVKIQCYENVRETPLMSPELTARHV
jgi:hypothetical protein